MNSKVRGGLTAAILAAAVVAFPSQAAASAFCTWQPNVLPLPAGFQSGGLEAADGSWRAGSLSLDGAGPFDDAQVGRWHNGSVESLGLPFDTYTEVHGVSSTGVVVGAASEPNAGMRPVRYRDGAWETLASKGTVARAFDVNAKGDTVGYDVNLVAGDYWEELLVWSANGAVRVLPPPAAGAYLLGEPRIDDDGTVVASYGRTVGNTSRSESYVWTPGARASRKLVSYQPGDGVAVTDIRGGHIVGQNFAANGTTTGVEWNTAGQVVRTIPGRPMAVNAAGLVVGRTTTDNLPAVWAGSRGQALPGPTGTTIVWPQAISGNEVAGFAAGDHSLPVVWRKTC